MIKNLIYDLDGTLINSYKDIIFSFNYAFKKNNLKKKINVNFFKKNANLGSNFFIKSALGNKNYNLKKIQKDFLNHYNHNLKNTTLKKGVVDFLKYSKLKKYCNILCTNKKKVTAINILKKLKIYKYFNYIIGIDTFLLLKKPEIGFILKIKKKFKLSSENTAVIGDTDVDSILARRAKMNFYLVRGGYTKKKITYKNFSFSDFNNLKIKLINEKI